MPTSVTSQPVFNRLAFVLLGGLLLAGCEPNAAPEVSPAEALPGGATTVTLLPFPSFEKPVANLPTSERAHFFAGKALAEQPWIKAPATTNARDGLGPVYNARTCLACHINGGKGIVPASGGSLSQGIVRLSIKPRDTQKDAQLLRQLGVVPEPVYGDQLQTQSVSLAHQLRSVIGEGEGSPDDVAPEAYVAINWLEKPFTYPDGTKTQLRYPEITLRHLGYGPLHDDVQMSLRNAPAIHGMGLLELIAQSSINNLADPDDTNGDGISGRVNYVWHAEKQQTVPGRFGYKANRASLAMAIAGAFANDVGISNPMFATQPCTALQPRCVKQADGNDADGVELPQHLLDLVVNFNRNIGVPERRNANRPNVQHGRTLFYQSGCNDCHQPSFVTQPSAALPHLADQTIWPYSDLLLHDLGPGLADGRPDFIATASEWRTQPLWGLGLNREVNGSFRLLHDGRARTVAEAILWHDGEAAAATQKFVHLTQKNRQALVEFVESL